MVISQRQVQIQLVSALQLATMGGRLRFDAPLTRLRERNNFRQAILDYQQGSDASKSAMKME